MSALSLTAASLTAAQERSSLDIRVGASNDFHVLKISTTWPVRGKFTIQQNWPFLQQISSPKITLPRNTLPSKTHVHGELNRAFGRAGQLSEKKNLVWFTWQIFSN
jgi:hypothetical protein